MKLDISKVELSKNDLRREVTIPTALTNELSYLIGIHVGDGSMNIYKGYSGNSIWNRYVVSYYGHEIDELEFHDEYIQPIIKKLFNITARRSRGYKTTLRTYINSKAITTFLNKSIGLPLGPKTTIDIPDSIKNSGLRIKRKFIQGLADTDFCMTFKKRYSILHYYPSVNFCNESKALVISTSKILDECQIKHSTSFDIKNVRKGVTNIIHQIHIYGEENLAKWMKLIGFNSTKYLTKYRIWKKYGYCPPNTNIIERRNILKGSTDINSHYGGVAQPG